ncbi:stemmadenine O-acetyltransferase-like [Prosopis cineraria]|uniref:stemmadenine O-acetyltransferase-like n=1 Tax=Prosopis cineraria TaxID=364024 RepID=UPI00240FF473|nr:stemmadenine O-acetyltransferase-like [Prosopis cineraria]
MVKPSSPTPQHLRRYNLSFLDQITPQVNNSMVYFFDADDVANKFNINDVSDLLKKSLSQLLTHYYPLAGRLINKNLIVDCNDEGAPYIETRVSCHLSHVITDNPSPADVRKLLPFEMDEAVDTVLGVQVNVFDCGGIAIGVCISHKIADALSYFQFVKTWAAVTRGEQEPIRTHFQSSTLFPPKDVSGYDPDSLVAKDKIVCKRFVFEASTIESLRAKYSEKMTNVLGGHQKSPSRVELLSTFIWTRFLAATKEESGSKKKIHLVAWTANLRPRMEPPLPDYAFGNYYWPMRTLPTLDEKGECHDLGLKLREEVNKIDNDFIVQLRESQQWNPEQKREEMVRSIGNNVQPAAFAFTSLCRFPVYEVDFGWGNPMWVGPPTWKFKNVVTLKDTKSSGGIEAYASLAEKDMAKFEHDEEFLAYVSTTGLK